MKCRAGLETSVMFHR